MSRFIQGLGGVNYQELLPIIEQRESQLERPHNQVYREVLESIRDIKNQKLQFDNGKIVFGETPDSETLDLLKKLIPWRKGPFWFGDLELDAEWRSDFKWDRLMKADLDLKDKRVLDIGCNNGYFMFRMLEHKPRWVYGIDPVVHNWVQFQLLKRFSGQESIHFDMLGVEHLTSFKAVFDTVFFMGIIYHHRHPLAQLRDIKDSMVPGGELILETLGIPGQGSYSLFPEDRYAGMRNVWFVPTKDCLYNWLKRTHFVDIELVSQVPTTTDEQRWTSWIRESSPSLKDFLDEKDQGLTIEGHPAPDRIIFKARKKSGK